MINIEVNEGSFEWALDKLRRSPCDKLIARTGWNGKNMYLFLYQPQDKREDGSLIWNPYVVMKTVQNTHVPWLCSQTDLLACDWTEVNSKGQPINSKGELI